MANFVPAADRINSFAVVSYIPGVLGDLLTRLRQELVPGCVARAHVTILPPRPLRTDLSAAEAFFRQTASTCQRFSLTMPAVEVFENTLVVFLGIGEGAAEVRELHDRFNTGPLYYPEPYPFHPHVTLAQGVAPGALANVRDAAVRSCKDWVAGDSTEIDRVTLVQNTASNCWVDLVDCQLQPRLTVPGPVR